jgi:hypothetical protein
MDTSVVNTGPRPGWTIPAEFPDYDPSLELETSGGLFIVTSDEQIRWEAGVTTSYYRRLNKIIDRSGLEAGSTIRLAFDPLQETLTLNSVRIERNGVWRDATADVKIDLLRRESGMGIGILDGRLTALIILPNVQVGDLIEYEVTYVNRISLFSNGFATTVSLSTTEPIAMMRTIISLPAGTAAEVRQHGEASPLIKRSTKQGFDLYSWTMTELHAKPDEADRPGSYVHWPFAEISTWKDWGAVSQELLPHYDPQIDLPEEFKNELNAIAAKWPAKTDQLTEVLRLIQDDIRYLSLSMGTGGFIPRRPDEVISSGFGDCKDKSLLFAAALWHIGIQAHVALVKTYAGELLAERLPTHQTFDHAITRVELDGKTFWLDPTLTHRGGRGADIIQSSYGNALVIKTGTRDLEAMPLFLEAMPAYFSEQITTDIYERFILPQTWDGDMRIEVSAVHRGPAADQIRSSFAQYGKISIERDYLQYYDTMYPGIQTSTPIEYIDNRDKNIFKTIENYHIPARELRKDEIKNEFIFSGSSVLELLPKINASGRTSPYYTGERRKARMKALIDYYTLDLEKEKDIDIETPYFKFSRTSKGVLLYEWTIERKPQVISPDNLRDYIQSVDKARNEAVRQYNITDYIEKLDKKKPKPDSALTRAAKGFLARAKDRARQISE